MEDVARYRDRLLAQRAELESLLRVTGQFTGTVELDQASVGRLSRLDAIQQQEMALATRRRHQQQIGRIDAALSRLEAGDYGWCVTCGEAIASKRLGLDPATPTCIACAA